MRYALLFLLIMPVAAAQGGASADVLEFGGAVSSDGDLAGISINTVSEGTLEKLSITADRGYALTWTETGVAGPRTGDDQIGLGVEEEHARLPAQGFQDRVRLEGIGHDQGHLLNVASRSSEAGVLFTGGGLVADVEQGLCLGDEGLTATLCPGYDERAAFPTSIVMPSPGQRFTAQGKGNLILTGDLLVLDILGIDLEGSFNITGRAQSDPGGGFYEQTFTRLVLEGARVHARVDGAHDQVAWVAQEADSAVDGTLVIKGGAGVLATSEGDVQLDGDEQFEGVLSILSSPGRGGIVLAGASGQEATTVASGASATGLPFLAGLLGLLPLAGIGLTVRRSRAHASMVHVERALSRGRFGRASKLADRLIKQNPRDESAHLGRAIALTKSGRAEAAVAGLGSLLEDHRPTDGTLHYTLGVALADLGRDAEAREAMADAVRRTPALLDEVATDLRPRYETGAYS